MDSIKLKAVELDEVTCKGCIFDIPESRCAVKDFTFLECLGTRREDGRHIIWVLDTE